MSLNIHSLRYRFPQQDERTWELSVGPISIEKGELVLLIGNSGSGKSTLLRAIQGLLPAFHGGELQIDQNPQADLNDDRMDVGLMLQDADAQFIMPDVLSELVFGMEQLGLSRENMLQRLTDLQSWFDWQPFQMRSVEQCSGGEKQKIALASILLMHPNVLLLDEPTAHLDQTNLHRLLDTIKKLKQANNQAIVIADHHISAWLPLTDRIIWIDAGKICWQGNVADWLEMAKSTPQTWHWLPSVEHAQALYQAVNQQKNELTNTTLYEEKQAQPRKNVAYTPPSFQSIFVTDLHFSYPDSKETLDNFTFEIPLRQLTALLGPNGSGKSTLLKILAGILKMKKGSIQFGDQLNVSDWSAAHRSCWFGYVSQQSNDHLLHDKVEDELWYSLKLIQADHDRLHAKAEIDALADTFELSKTILNAHPRDLSSGERQRVALASVLIRKPVILLIDEPTHGLTNRQKERFTNWIRSHHAVGGAALIATHDHEFAAEWATNCLLMQIEQGRRSIHAASASQTFLHHPIYRSSLTEIGEVYRIKDAVDWLRSRQTAGSLS